MTAASEGTEVIVDSAGGKLSGIWTKGCARFAGIPFAAPPVGELRFRPPRPPARWDGIRPAQGFGPISPQNPSLMDALFGGEAEQWDEDCLYLNVWTPDPAARGLPVMVWIHGGAFEMGSGSSPLYHGASFARAGVVLVTINYRLGSFGFLDLSSLDPEESTSGNVGLLDQVAALEWVRDNIGDFGGDPGNVTVFGESAGAMSVSLLMAMPSARGLFSAAIAQSGSASVARTPEIAALDAEEFLRTAGLRTVEDARAADPSTLLAAHSQMALARLQDPEKIIQETGNPTAFLAFRPVRDGVVLPPDPLTAIAGGAAAGVRLLIGTNSEEWKLFSLLTPPAGSEEDLERRLSLVVPDPRAAIAAYRRDHPDAGPAALEGAVLTDVVFRIPAVRMADAQAAHAPVWQYLFTWPSPAMGGMLGAAHAMEIPFVFDLVEDHRLHVMVGADAPVALARAMQGAWVAFARDGDPSRPDAPWPRVDDGGRPTMVFDADSKVVDDPDGASRRFWDGVPDLLG